MAFRQNEQGRSGAEADVAVRVRAIVVAVQIEQASVRAVVPVAAAIDTTPPFLRHAPVGYDYSEELIHPPSILPISFSSLDHTSWSPGEIR